MFPHSVTEEQVIFLYPPCLFFLSHFVFEDSFLCQGHSFTPPFAEFLGKTNQNRCPGVHCVSFVCYYGFGLYTNPITLTIND